MEQAGGQLEGDPDKAQELRQESSSPYLGIQKEAGC